LGDQRSKIDLLERARRHDKTLGIEEMQEVGNLGTSESERLMRDFAFERANAAGFDKSIGREDIGEQARLQNRIKEFAVTLEQPVQAKVELQSNLDEVMRAVTASADEAFTRYRAEMVERIKQAVAESAGRIGDQNNERMNGQRAIGAN
jgi:hypothetical protein